MRGRARDGATLAFRRSLPECGRTLDLLRHERVARVYYAVLAQSALGNGAAYIALLVVASTGSTRRGRSASSCSPTSFRPCCSVRCSAPLPTVGHGANCLILSDVVRASRSSASCSSTALPRRSCWRCWPGRGPVCSILRPWPHIPSLVKPSGCRRRRRCTARSPTSGFIAGPGLGRVLLLVGGPEMILVRQRGRRSPCRRGPDPAALRGRPCRSRSVEAAATRRCFARRGTVS